MESSKSGVERNNFNKKGGKMSKWFVVIMLVYCLGLFFWIPEAKAGKEEMYILINLLVEKGTITNEEGKEIMAAVDNIVKKQKQDAEKNSVKTSAAKNMKIGGYIQTRYDQYDFKGKRDEFSIKRARASLSGNVIDNVAFKMEFDLTKGKDNDLLTDAYIKFTNFPKANITLGQFKIPYSEEFLMSSAALDTIERSIPVTKMASEYDRGIMVDGDALEKIIYYGVALVNGTGANKGDDNDSKDIVARLVLTPWGKSENALSGIKLGAAYQTGEQKMGVNKEDRTRHDFMLRYQYKNFRALAEYLY
ncbi:MAG: OprO/OprP family phosphate-selective porin, partial [bacterium]|nr:OprO/OprP family phosphate-selective porin [bacterium]